MESFLRYSSAPSLTEIFANSVIGTRDEVYACLKIQRAVREMVRARHEEGLSEASLGGDECAVCYGLLCEPVRWSRTGDATSCDHTFCKPCVRQWRMQSNAACPLCRAPATRPTSSDEELAQFMSRTQFAEMVCRKSPYDS